MTAAAVALFTFGVLVGVAASARPTGAGGTSTQGAQMLSRISQSMFGSRPRAIASALAGMVLVGAASALAAWLVYSGASGTGTVKAGSASTVGAITITPSPLAGDNLVAPGTSGDVWVKAASQDPVYSYNLTSLTVSGITSDNAACNSAATGPSSLVWAPSVTLPKKVSPGTSARWLAGTLTAPANFADECSGATFTLTFSGATQKVVV